MTIFEASAKGGLSGKGEMVYGQVVDIPLRIIGQGYYKTVEAIAKSVHVRLEPIREDNLTQMHYADDRKTFSYCHSYVKNFFSLVPYIFELLRFRGDLYSSSTSSSVSCMEQEGVDVSEKDSQGERKETNVCESWGEWMSRHGYATSMYRRSDKPDGVPTQRGGGECSLLGDVVLWRFSETTLWCMFFIVLVRQLQRCL